MAPAATPTTSIGIIAIGKEAVNEIIHLASRDDAMLWESREGLIEHPCRGAAELCFRSLCSIIFWGSRYVICRFNKKSV